MAFKVKESKHSVTVHAKIKEQKYLTQITAGEKKLIGDEPISMGGQDLGFNPFELLASSLSMCTAATLRAYTDRKEIEVGEINVQVEFSNNAFDKVATFKKVISFENTNLEEEVLTKLLQKAEACPVNRLLTNTIVVETKMKGVS